LRKLFGGITIPNAICFAPDGRTAYFADTPTQAIQKVALDAAGWPCAAPEVFVDLAPEGLYPDGATVDAEGNLWNAQWGAGRVACYSPQGTFLRAIAFDAPHTSCPAFGGPGFSTLYCTTALEGMSLADRAALSLSGATFSADAGTRGLAEPTVDLGA